MANFKVAFLVIVLSATLIAPAAAAPPHGPLVALELETVENTLDGCMACGCRAIGALEPGSKQGWWIVFGLVKSHTQNDWEAVASPSHCGNGSFENAAADFRRTIGMPYVILDLSTTAAVVSAKDIHLKSLLTIRKLDRFDEDGQPVYGRGVQKRMLNFSSDGDITLPLLVADPREKESLGVHEVLVRLRTTVLGREPAASYGTVSVSADVPGAEILLDGGFVGRIAEGKPIILQNVRAGTREIRVRDFSDREARREVVVKKGGTLKAAVNLLNLPSAETRKELLAIGKNPQGHTEYWRAQDGAIVVRIPGGEFLRGSPEGVGQPHERPQHRVHVSEFLIDKTEVTWRQFRKYAAATGARVPSPPLWGTPDDYPTSFILWEEAKGYCEWVGGRLPTEAEWEKAARGTDGSQYPWGNDWDSERCNSISGGPHRPESVGNFPSCVSPYGALDMPGSMWEWGADWYGESYYAESSSRDPQGPTSGSRRVIRGGGWMSQPLWLRTAHRFGVPPTTRKADHSFRCAQDPPE
jgi:formylglycine-generating enzyme required for sulfatase activity